MPSTLVRTLVSGGAASVAMAAALALMAKSEGRRAIQPINATSHWLHGETAGRTRSVDLRHTLLGFATHYGASLFWAAIFHAVRRAGPRRPPLADAAGVTALAALVDYGLVPKRLTPGWEQVVSARSIGAAYAAMALALSATCPQTRERGRI